MADDDLNTTRTDQLHFQNPVTRYPVIEPPEQHQPEPGLESELQPRADLGEYSYRGTGRLEGRKALVTGGDSGIGAAVAIAFAREGADVAITYLPAEEKDGQDVARIISESGRRAVTIPGDLTDTNFCKQVVDRAAEELGGLDILVNNAGKQVVSTSLDDLPDDQLDKTFQTNILAMFRVDRGIPAVSPAAGLRLHQGRDQQLHEGLGDPVGRQRYPGQFGCTGPHLDADPADGRPAHGKAARVRPEHPDRTRRSTHRTGTRVRVPRVTGIELCDRLDRACERWHAHSVSRTSTNFYMTDRIASAIPLLALQPPCATVDGMHLYFL